jgi:hypothetical protein
MRGGATLAAAVAAGERISRRRRAETMGRGRRAAASISASRCFSRTLLASRLAG